MQLEAGSLALSQPDRGTLRESLSRGVLTGHPNSTPVRRTVDGVDNRAEVREFLISRRAKITPQQAGCPTIGARRVPGLRRGEVAALAGVSVEYYSKLERGALAGVSASVLDAIARALQLDDAERAHLFHLAHAADGTSAGMRPRRRPSQALDTPAEPALGAGHVHRARRSSATAGWTCSPPTTSAGPCTPPSTTAPPADQPNFARFTFLDPTPPTTSTPTGTAPPTSASPSCAPRPAATRTTRTCTTSSASCPPAASDFRRRWGSPRRPLHGAGTKHFHHNVVGDLDLAYESVDMVSEPGLTLTLYAAEPASPTAHALDLLASWTTTPLEIPNPTD